MAANSNVRRRPLAKSRRNPKSNVDFTDREQVNKVARSASGFIHVVRLIILSLGACAIAGTTIALVDPPKRERAKPIDLPSPPKLTTLPEKLGQKNNKLETHYL
jgi:hypothetical protein